MFPNWNDAMGKYTTFVNPEMLLFTGVASTFAFPADAVASTMGTPINKLFWVAGSWGGMYPMTGFSGSGQMNDPVRFSSLTGVRALSMLHRLGMMRETIGNDNLCERNTRFIIRKDAFRWQFLAPSPETNGPVAGTAPAAASANQVQEVNPPQRFGNCNHATGASTAAWGMWRDVPVTGEDHSYLLFQWTDCCVGITP
jgi:conjugal transfer pilus assembly protein TraU